MVIIHVLEARSAYFLPLQETEKAIMKWLHYKRRGPKWKMIDQLFFLLCSYFMYFVPENLEPIG